jgi:hypothetical protein
MSTTASATSSIVSAEISVDDPATVDVFAPSSSRHPSYHFPEVTIALGQRYGRGGVIIHASIPVAEAMLRKIERALAPLPKR